METKNKDDSDDDETMYEDSVEEKKEMDVDSDDDDELPKTLGAVLLRFKGPQHAIPKLSAAEMLAMENVPRRIKPALTEYLAHDFPEIVSSSKATRSAQRRVCCV